MKKWVKRLIRDRRLIDKTYPENGIESINTEKGILKVIFLREEFQDGYLILFTTTLHEAVEMIGRSDGCNTYFFRGIVRDVFFLSKNNHLFYFNHIKRYRSPLEKMIMLNKSYGFREYNVPLRFNSSTELQGEYDKTKKYMRAMLSHDLFGIDKRPSVLSSSLLSRIGRIGRIGRIVRKFTNWLRWWK